MRDGYGYAAFCQGVAGLHGRECFVARVLKARRPVVPSTVLWCEGPLDAHHLIAKQRIRRELAGGHGGRSLDELLRDPRSGIPVCRRHHDLLEHRMLHLERGELPEQAEDFAVEVGLGWSLDRDYGARTEAA